MRCRLPIFIFPVINYFIAFVVLPFFVLKISSELFTLITLTLWLIAAAALERKHLKIRHILFGIIPMWLLVLVYCPDGLYGIGNDGILDFSPKEFDALVVCTVISLVQVVVTLIMCAFQKMWCLIHKKVQFTRAPFYTRDISRMCVLRSEQP